MIPQQNQRYIIQGFFSVIDDHSLFFQPFERQILTYSLTAYEPKITLQMEL